MLGHTELVQARLETRGEEEAWMEHPVAASACKPSGLPSTGLQHPHVVRPIGVSRLGFSFQRTGQWTLSSVLAKEWSGEMGSFLGNKGASGGVREDKLQFQLPAAFLDSWTVQNPLDTPEEPQIHS